MDKVKNLADGPYEHSAHEEKILEDWIANKYYKPETADTIIRAQIKSGVRDSASSNGSPATREDDHNSEKSTGNRARTYIPSYTIINPPPNAYARPHMGNVSGYAYQDLFGRRARMQGMRTLLFPGKDHAAQQAEIVYIRDVLAPEGKKRADYTREEFYKEAYEYFTKIAAVAQGDEKRIGLSADFDRDLFTLDPRVAATVYNTFSKMWKDKMVYKGVRIVNWSPGLNSAVADIDTEREEVDSTMYYLKYALPQVDQDILNLRQEFAKKTKKIELKSSTDLEPEFKKTPDLRKLAKKLDRDLKLAKITARDSSDHEVELSCWLLMDAETSKETDEDTDEDTILEAKFIGMSIPLQAEGVLIATAAGTEDALTAEEEELIFKMSNQIFGSAFTRKFKDDDETPNNEYARGFVLGTVRPETKFGDTAIAVNPEDKRFAALVGRQIDLISINGPIKIKVITDNSISIEFGTGMMKVTPAHAATDYEIYLRHNQAHPDDQIGYKNVIGKDSKLNKLAGVCAGLHAEKDRDKVAEMMKEKGLVVFAEPAKSNVIICERTKTIIQPIMSSQWFIDTDKLKVPALEALEAGKVNVHPDYMTKKLGAWLENLRDWPISRSIWWGYRIPVWYKGELTEKTDENGQVVLSIGGAIVKDMEEAVEKGLMKLELNGEFAPILVPGLEAPENSSYYAKLKKQYSWAQIVDTKEVKQTYADYERAFAKINFSGDSVVVAHSLGSAAIIQYLLAQNKTNDTKIKHLILLAPSNPKSDHYQTYLDKGFWRFNTDGEYTDISAQMAQIADKLTVIYSDDDEVYTVEDFQKYIATLGTADKVKVIQESGKKHYVKKGYSHSSQALEGLLKSLNQEYEAGKTEKSAQLVEDGWVQDGDVFDTWYSSGQWPVATLESEGLMDFYPTQLLETGFDILELWVSRMIMLGLYITDEVPFSDVYLHGLIKAEDGQKMSKSKGNLVYTEDIIDQYGADTLRMLYIVGNKAGASYRVDQRKLKGYRNFLNKTWNVHRFILSNLATPETNEINYSGLQESIAAMISDSNYDQVKSLSDYKAVAKTEVSAELEKANSETNLGTDLSMLKAMVELTTAVNEHLDNFRPGMAAEEIIQHSWHVFADIYIEQVKQRLFLVDRDGNPINRSEAEMRSRQQALEILSYCGLNYLKLLHPFVPFITETIWQHYPEQMRESETIMYSNWPR